MSELVDPSEIEGIVGVQRHPTEHWGRLVSAEEMVYILHSAECVDSGIDLRDCPYAIAADDGVDLEQWGQDVAVRLNIGRYGILEPA